MKNMTAARASILIADFGAKKCKQDYDAYKFYRDVALRVLHWHQPHHIKLYSNKGRWRDWLHREHPDMYKVVFKRANK